MRQARSWRGKRRRDRNAPQDARGYLVETVEAMATAIALVRRIRPEACRDKARRYFSHKAMANAYFDYWQMLAGGASVGRRGVA